MSTGVVKEADRLAPDPFRWIVLSLATLMQLGVSLPQQTPAAIGPVLSRSLGLSRAELGLLTSAIWGGMLIGMLPFGMLVDRYGERSMLLAGGALLAGFLLVASRATWFEPHLRGTAMGIRQTGVTAAGVLAAVALPPIAIVFGWRAAFVAVAAMALLG